MEKEVAIGNIRSPGEISKDLSFTFSGERGENYYKNLIENLERIGNSNVVTPKWVTSSNMEHLMKLKNPEVMSNIQKDLGIASVHEYTNNLQSQIKKPVLEAFLSNEKQGAFQPGSVKFDDAVSKLFLACENGEVGVLKKLLAAGVNVQETRNGVTPLHIASWNGHAEVVTILLAHGAHIDARDAVGGQTALFFACCRGHGDVVKLLVNKGADVNAVNAVMWSPLHAACQFDNTSVVTTLLQNKADINARNNQGATPLHVASARNRWEVVSLLIDHNADIEAADVLGFSPLHGACFWGCKEAVEILIRKNANLNAVTIQRRTPLLLACVHLAHVISQARLEGRSSVTGDLVSRLKDCSGIIILLVNNNCDVNTEDEFKMTALHLVSYVGQKNLVKLFLQYKAKVEAKNTVAQTPLHLACLQPNKRVVDILLSNKALVDAQDSFLNTPLMFASCYGYFNIIKKLIENNALINAKNKEGLSPLCYACLNGHKEIVDFLISHKAETDVVSTKGITVLHCACHNGNKELICMLLDLGHNVNAEDIYGRTPLHLASLCNTVDAVRILLQRGADVDHPAKDGFTSLHFASLTGFLEAVKLLLDYKANVNSKTKHQVTSLQAVSENGHVKVTQTLMMWGASEVTPLHYASFYGHMDVVKVLLHHHARVYEKDSLGCSALHLACMRGHLNVVDTLLFHGAHVNEKTKEGETTPLYLACASGVLDLVRKLLQHGADLEAEDTEGDTALQAAILADSFEVVKLLVDHGARTDHQNKRRWMPLHFACQCRDQRIFDLIIEKSSNVDVTTSDDVTPLHIASVRGHASAIEALIRRGANVMLKSNNGVTALHYACRSGQKNAVELLLKEKVSLDETTSTGETPLHVASIIGSRDIAEILLQNLSNVETKDINGNTPLHLASLNGHKEVVDLLIERGSDVDAMNCEGQTPLHAACFMHHYNIVGRVLPNCTKGDITTKPGEAPIHFACFLRNEEIVRRLLLAKVNVNVADINGMTPMHIVCFTGHLDIMKLLIQYGSFIDAKNKAGRTPLFVACEKGFTEIVRYLCESNARPDIADASGFTALHIASNLGYFNIVDILLRRSKTEIEAKDIEGKTPLHHASFNGHSDIAKLLLLNGAQVDAQDLRGRTPLHLACQNDHINVANVLLQNGSKTDSTTFEGHTPLSIAILFNKKNIENMLLQPGKNTFSEDKLVDTEHRASPQTKSSEPQLEGRTQMKGSPAQEMKYPPKETILVKEDIQAKPLLDKTTDVKEASGTNDQRSYESKISFQHMSALSMEQKSNDKGDELHHNQQTREDAEDGSETEKVNSLLEFGPDIDISHSPIFNPRWQIGKSFSSAGGTLQKLNSDIVLHVPESCVHLGQWIDVKSAVCADAAHVRHVLRTKLQYKNEEWLASPVAEYSSSHSFSLLKGPFRIELPHCLPPNPDPDLIHVYCVLRHSDGHLSLNRVRPERTDIRRKDSTEIGCKVKREADHIGPAVSAADDASPDLSPLCRDDSSSLSTGSLLSDSDRKDSSNTKVSGFEKTRLKLSTDRPPTSDNGQKRANDCQEVDDDVQWDQSATFRLLPDGKVSITTDHFSAYFCAYCGIRQPPPQLNARAYGSHTERRDGRRAAHVKVLVWDDRLKIADFRQTLGIQHEDDYLGEEILYLADTLQLQDSNLRMSFEILEDCEEWQHKRKNNGDHISAIRESFPLEKYYVRWCGECEEERVKVFGDLRPIRKTWHIENKLNSTPGSHLECLVELEQVPNSNADDRNDNIIFTSVQMVLNMALPQNEMESIYEQLKLMTIGQLEVLASLGNLISDQDMERLRNRWKNDDAYKDQLLCRVSDSPKLLQATLSALREQKVSPASRQSRPSNAVEFPVSSDVVGADGVQKTEFIDSIENMSTQGSECSDS